MTWNVYVSPIFNWVYFDKINTKVWYCSNNLYFDSDILLHWNTKNNGIIILYFLFQAQIWTLLQIRIMWYHLLLILKIILDLFHHLHHRQINKWMTKWFGSFVPKTILRIISVFKAKTIIMTKIDSRRTPLIPHKKWKWNRTLN